MQAISGWTTYVIHSGIFFIEDFIIAEMFQQSDKVRLIFYIILITNLFDKSHTIQHQKEMLSEYLDK